MMSKFWLMLIMFVVAEALLAFLFSIIAQVFYKKAGIDFKSIVKGIIERMFLTIALVNDLTSALTFFSALKLATRLKHKEPPSTGEASEDNNNKFNDYYLIGNLASAAMAILYVYVYKNFDQVPVLMKLVS